jgi:polar amino acid transport system substrate-binding protein
MMTMFKLCLDRRRLCVGVASLLAASALLAATASAQTVAEIKAKGKLVVGIQGDNPPWGFVNAQGKQEGFDADIAELFGKELGVPVEFTPLAVANRIPALTTRKVDILFATMAMFPDRAKAIQFSKPYAANEINLVAPKATKIASAADMASLTIGVPRSSAQDTAVTKEAPNATIRRFDDDAATIQAMLSGQVQAVGGNQFYPMRLNQAKPDNFEAKLVFQRIYNGAGTRMGQKEWNATANAFVDKIKANGELAKIYQKWMGATPPEFPESVEGVPFTVQ